MIMRILSLLLLSLTVLAGCEDVSDHLHDRFGAVEPHSRIVTGDRGAVAAAALLACRRLGFEIGSSDASGGFEATSRIQHGQGEGTARQLIARVTFAETGPTQTEVRILLLEEVEDASPAARGEQPLRDHGLYQTFFEALQQAMDAGPQTNAAPTK